jgi:mediator of RNA polymerase II transcription subunit 1
MIERLESLTRQLGLKFMVGPSGVELFISSDMFYLEIVLDQTGAVKDVKVHHESKLEQQSCSELVNCLSRGDFADFTAQLEGFASIYQLNAEKKNQVQSVHRLAVVRVRLEHAGPTPVVHEGAVQSVVQVAGRGSRETTRGPSHETHLFRFALRFVKRRKM